MQKEDFNIEKYLEEQKRRIREKRIGYAILFTAMWAGPTLTFWMNMGIEAGTLCAISLSPFLYFALQNIVKFPSQ